MSLQLFAHPFSSYCQKVLIALWADETPFEYRMLDPDHPENIAELEGALAVRASSRSWSTTGVSVIETTPIIEHLHAHHRGKVDWIPSGDDGTTRPASSTASSTSTS